MKWKFENLNNVTFTTINLFRVFSDVYRVQKVKRCFNGPVFEGLILLSKQKYYQMTEEVFALFLHYLIVSNSYIRNSSTLLFDRDNCKILMQIFLAMKLQKFRSRSNNILTKLKSSLLLILLFLCLDIIWNFVSFSVYKARYRSAYRYKM